jgi:hypothetical protein
MCTPLTYEALIDEVVGIQNSSVTVDRAMLGEDDTAAGKKKEEKKELPPTVTIPLNSNDKLYDDIRDYNISILGRYLSEKSREIRKMYEARPKGSKDMEINELRDFVKKIPSLKESYAQLTLHINMAEKIQSVTNSKSFRDRWNLEHKMMDGEKQIEELLDKMAKQEPLMEVVRLMCLQSLVDKGIKGKVFDQMRTELVHAYGYEIIFLLDNLDRVGLLKKRETPGTFSSLVKKLNLIMEDNLALPDDMSYVTSGDFHTFIAAISLILTVWCPC